MGISFKKCECPLAAELPHGSLESELGESNMIFTLGEVTSITDEDKEDTLFEDGDRDQIITNATVAGLAADQQSLDTAIEKIKSGDTEAALMLRRICESAGRGVNLPITVMELASVHP